MLRALNRAVGVEQAAQESTMEFARAPLDQRSDALELWRDAETLCEIRKSGGRQSCLVRARGVDAHAVRTRLYSGVQAAKRRGRGLASVIAPVVQVCRDERLATFAEP